MPIRSESEDPGSVDPVPGDPPSTSSQPLGELSSGPPAVPGYDIIGELGRGGMGIVLKAWQIRAKRFVALKMIMQGAESDLQARERFEREAQAVARLSHPHIVRIYEVGQTVGWPWFSLEFCGGGSLARKLSGNPIQPAAAVELLEKLAWAVAYAHDQQVVHRDLKPANILLTVDGEPKISDFGLAKRLDQSPASTKRNVVVGTPNYLPPEVVCRSVHQLPHAGDIYALGAILYECLTGRPPFKGAGVMETLEQIREQDVIPPRLFERKIPQDLEAICLTCLNRDPARRYPTARSMAEDLRRFREGKPVTARPGSVRAVTRWLWERADVRRWAWLAGLAGIAIWVLSLLIIINRGLVH